MEDLAKTVHDLSARMGLVRKAAARALGEAGAVAAVPALTAALDDEDHEVREEAARALGRLRDARAREALERLLQDEKASVRRAAQEAIAALDRPAAPRAGPSPKPAPSPMDALIAEALDGTGAAFVRTPFGYEVEVPLGKRKQRVRVIFGNLDADGDRTILVQTPCGPAIDKNYRWALRLNVRSGYGALGIRRTGEKDEFVWTEALLEATVQPQELRKAILGAADRGDWVEKQVTGGRDDA